MKLGIGNVKYNIQAMSNEIYRRKQEEEEEEEEEQQEQEQDNDEETKSGWKDVEGA
jgi:Sec-independent protein translocase protein TatA